MYLNGMTIYHDREDLLLRQVLRRATGGDNKNGKASKGGSRSKVRTAVMAVGFCFVVYGWIKNAQATLERAREERRREVRETNGEDRQSGGWVGEPPESAVKRLKGEIRRVVEDTPFLCPICRRKRVNR